MINVTPEDLLYKMTNFYQDNLPIDSSLEKMHEIYMKTISVLQEDYNFINDNAVLEKARMLHTIPYFKLNIDSGMYSVARAKMLKLMGFESMLSAMDQNGEYIALNFEEKESRQPVIFSLTLKTSFSNPNSLKLYEDYFLRDNRLYLLPDFVSNRDMVLKTLHAFNIKVDRKNLEKNWGALFKVETGPLIPKHQYRDVLSAFQRTLLSDLTIREIVEGIRLATKWEEFNIEDIMTPSLSIGKRRLYDEWMLSPAKFIVSLPEYLIKDKIRLNILLALLDEVKEAQTNYQIIFSILREDYLEKIDDRFLNLVQMKPLEIFTPEEKSVSKVSVKAMESLFPLNRYDVGRHYNYRLYYDSPNSENLEVTMDSGEALLMDDPGTIFDTPWMHKSEYYRVEHRTFPEIPRSFEMISSNEQEHEFKVRSNTDGTTHFELLGSDEEYGKFQILDIIANDSNASEITFIHNANQSKKRYYKIRAVAGESVSLLTLPIDTQVI